MEKDEKEAGIRSILNYGHTIGHAIETVSGFQVKHGQAVAIGMVAAAQISRNMGWLKDEEIARLKKIIEKAGLTSEMPPFKTEDLMKAMKHDKKVLQDKIRLILLKSIRDTVAIAGCGMSERRRFRRDTWDARMSNPLPRGAFPN